MCVCVSVCGAVSDDTFAYVKSGIPAAAAAKRSKLVPKGGRKRKLSSAEGGRERGQTHRVLDTLAHVTLLSS